MGWIKVGLGGNAPNCMYMSIGFINIIFRLNSPLQTILMQCTICTLDSAV